MVIYCSRKTTIVRYFSIFRRMMYGKYNLIFTTVIDLVDIRTSYMGLKTFDHENEIKFIR